LYSAIICCPLLPLSTVRSITYMARVRRRCVLARAQLPLSSCDNPSHLCLWGSSSDRKHVSGVRDEGHGGCVRHHHHHGGGRHRDAQGQTGGAQARPARLPHPSVGRHHQRVRVDRTHRHPGVRSNATPRPCPCTPPDIRPAARGSTSPRHDLSTPPRWRAMGWIFFASHSTAFVARRRPSARTCWTGRRAYFRASAAGRGLRRYRGRQVHVDRGALQPAR
jgi:hypothetical protein